MKKTAHLIDNVSALSALSDGSRYFSELYSYLRAGVSYGIKFVVTASHMNEISSRSKQEIGTRIALRLGNKFDYSDAILCKCDYVPTDTRGRGLFNYDGQPLEFHTAFICDDEGERGRRLFLKKHIDMLKEKYKNYRSARKLPLLGSNETYSQFAEQFDYGRIPLGYRRDNMKPVAMPIKQLYCLSCLLGNPEGEAEVLGNLLYAFQRENMKLMIVKKAEESFFDEGGIYSADTEMMRSAKLYDCNSEDIDRLWSDILQKELKPRKEYRLKYAEEHGLTGISDEIMIEAAPYIRKNTRPIMVLVESFRDFCLHASEAAQNVIPTILQRSRGYNIYFTGIFRPGDMKEVSNHGIFLAFNDDEFMILAGGCFSQFGLLTLPPGFTKNSEPDPQYNNCLVRYRRGYYQLTMPCGEIKPKTEDEDDASIF